MDFHIDLYITNSSMNEKTLSQSISNNQLVKIS